MNLITMISLRNLFRQKRRNLLLGIAIALGVMILVIAHAFSNGITDILFNRILVRVVGHVSLVFNEKGGVEKYIFRDRARILKIVKDNAENTREIEETLGIFARAIGNGKSDSIILVAIDLSQSLSEETRKEIEESFRMLEGAFTDLSRKDVENPIIISEEKAKYLNVKKNDIIRIRYTNVHGNNESARLTVIGIIKNDNVFMQGVTFIELNNEKKLLAYKPYEIGNINITINDPQKNAVKFADKIHSALTPDLAVIYGKINNGHNTDYATLLGYKTDDESKKIIENNLEISGGDKNKIFKKDSVLVEENLANKLGLKINDSFEVTYKNKFGENNTTVKYSVFAIFKNKELDNKNIILISDDKFYNTYYPNLPDITSLKKAYIPDKQNSIFNALAKEWELLPRTSTTEELEKKMKDISKKKWKATTVDIRTMYETASDILKLEYVLNLITVVAGLILFLIILIGVINTLRMTIRERTREIGTVRAIGMQKNDVKNSFILESFFLALFASIIGVIMAFSTMQILSKITFETHDNPMSILLVNTHLYFKPTFSGVIINMIFILLIVVITAYFPARRASNLSPSHALRHYE